MIDAGLPLKEVGLFLGKTPGSLFKSLRLRGWWPRPARKQDGGVYYKGVRYALEKTSGYYRASNGRGGRGGGKYLHLVLYEERHGPIPPGHDVHHANGDKIDNADENHQLVTKQWHGRHHNPDGKRSQTHAENRVHAVEVPGEQPGAAGES